MPTDTQRNQSRMIASIIVVLSILLPCLAKAQEPTSDYDAQKLKALQELANPDGGSKMKLRFEPPQPVKDPNATETAVQIEVPATTPRKESVAVDAAEIAKAISTPPAAVPQGQLNQQQALDLQLQALKDQVLEINRALFILEEDLLYPAGTQTSVFLSMDIGDYFTLDHVKLTIDDKDVTHHLYTPRELEALKRGAVQRLYMGNLKTGAHEVVAVFTGIGPSARDYKRAMSFNLEKQTGPHFVELLIKDDTAKQQPAFEVKQWD